MDLKAFQSSIRVRDPEALVGHYLSLPLVHAVPEATRYRAFKELVATFFPEAVEVHIVGSGNWIYSLNPVKLWTKFHDYSDIDVAVVSEAHFRSTWDDIRREHRSKWYGLPQGQRDRLLRNGENIYSGFASPKWLLDEAHPTAYSFQSSLNKLSIKDIGYRDVAMMFFRNKVELVDYYKRSFMAARRELLT